MRKIKILTMLIVALAAISLLAACNDADPEQKLREQGYVCITFDCNGGLIGNYERKYIYALPGSLLLRPGVISSSLAEPVLQEHYPSEWFLGEETEDGVDMSDTAWDFSSDRVPNEDFTLYLTWDEAFYFNFFYGTDFDKSYKIFIPKALTTAADLTQKPIIQDFTIIDCFKRADLTERIDFASEPLVHPRAAQKNFDVYIKGVEGNFKLVYSADDFAGISATTNLYLMNNISFEGKSWIMPNVYMGTIEGNNHTISDITASVTSTPEYYGLFNILSGAVIKNVTLSADITVTLGRQSTFYIGFLAGRVMSATLSDVTLTGPLKIMLTGSAINPTGYGAIYGRIDNNAVYEEVNVDYEGVEITLQNS